jgi:CHAT domain-containing protein
VRRRGNEVPSIVHPAGSPRPAGVGRNFRRPRRAPRTEAVTPASRQCYNYFFTPLVPQAAWSGNNRLAVRPLDPALALSDDRCDMSVLERGDLRRLTGVATFAAVAIAGVGGSTCRQQPPLDSLRGDLVRALGPVPLGEARFLGFPPPESRPSTWQRSRSSLQAVDARIEHERARRASPMVMADAGILDLASGRFAAAEAHFRAAAEKRGADARPLAELGAFWLTQATRPGGHPEDVLLALEALETALGTAPRLPEAMFNQAVALERLFLWHEAESAWLQYLRLDPGSSWSAVARARLATVREVLSTAVAERRDGRRHLLEILDAGGDGLTTAVARRPDVARLYGLEQLLGAWGGARRRYQEPISDRLLETARLLGGALVGAGGDPLLHDAVAAIDAASSGSPRRLDLLASGHFLVGEGLALEAAESYLEAARRFEEALPLLEQASTPFAVFAYLHLGVCRYYGGNYQEALALLTAARERAGAGRYPAVAGYSYWMTGVIHFVRAELPLALADHQAACRRFRALREPPHVAFVESMIAGDLLRLGQADASWRHRFDALSGVPRLADPRRIYTVLWSAAECLLNDGRPAAAQRFLSELIDNLGATASPGVLAEALSRRALIESGLGKADAAAADIAAGRRRLARVLDLRHRQRLAADLDLAEAQVLRPRDPARSIALLNRAIGFYAGVGYAINTAAALRERAAAFRASGRLGAAREDLDRALSSYEATRATLPGELARIAYFEQAQAISDDLVRLEHADLHDEVSAFLAADRARARSLLDRLRAPVAESGAGEPARDSLRDLQRQLPPGTRIVEYAVQADQTLAWVVGSTSIDAAALPAGSRRLAERVAAARRDLASATPDLAALRDLHALLIAPIEPLLTGVAALAIVPDGPLADLPFAALLDARSRHFLVQDHAIEVAPSARVYLRAIAAERRFSGLPRSVLAVAGDAFDRAAFAQLAPLPDVTREVQQLARLYPRAVVLRGTAATRSRVLAALAAGELIDIAGHAVPDPGVHGGSALLLAPPRRSELGGTGERADLLRAMDLADLSLHGTRLVILAACGTATGPAAAMEGNLSLARNFLAAGVPAVIASLWNVDDATAAAFLGAVHGYLARGSSPLDALHHAQLQFLARAPANPAAWAGFQLMGGALERRQVSRGPAGPITRTLRMEDRHDAPKAFPVRSAHPVRLGGGMRRAAAASRQPGRASSRSTSAGASWPAGAREVPGRAAAGGAGHPEGGLRRPRGAGDRRR